MLASDRCDSRTSSSQSVRARWVKPEFFNDRKIGQMGPVVALVYQALWCVADDGGTAICTPELLKGQMFTWWPAVGLPEIAEALRQLGESKRIDCYTIGDEDYAKILRWEKHQSVHNPSKFRNPVQQQQVTPNTEAVLRQDGGSPHHLDTQIARPLDTKTPRHGEGESPSPAARVELPREADEFLSMFYEPALTEKARERYRDVKRQLYDVIDLKHPGPKIRGGIRVKARSMEHLQDELRATMKDPPTSRDLAIVWLLQRLTNPPKGPSVTEKHQREQAADRQLEDQYFAASKRAGVQWANENPARYQTILTEVNAHYKGRDGSIVEMAKTSELTQRCAKECAFPTFEEWRESKTLAESAA